MDTADIKSEVFYYLCEYDIIAIPGFGGFICKYKPAAFHDEEGLFYPPTKYVAFNPKLSHDDQAFFNFLVKRNPPIAFKDYQSAIVSLIKDLNTKQIIHFPKLGRIYKDPEMNLHFIPDQNSNTDTSFGLPAIKVNTVPADVKQSEIAIVKTNAKEWIGPIALAACMIVAFLVWNPTFPYFKKESKALGHQKSTINSDAEATMGIFPDLNGPQIADEMMVEEAKPQLEEFIVIVGRFKNVQNIEKLTTKIHNQGYDIYVKQVNDGSQIIGVSFLVDSEQMRNKYLSVVRKDIYPKAQALVKKKHD